MKYLLALTLIFVTFSINAQYDSKIVIHTDTVDIHRRVKEAMIKSNFVVKDIQSDTISTYPKDFDRITGYTVIIALIEDSIVTLSGLYGRKKQDYFGYEKKSKEVHRILRFKGSKTWPILERIAKRIGADIIYSK